MKTLLCTLMLATLGTATAEASSALMITFDNPDQIAMPGQLLEFTGTITNLTADPLFLNSDDPNLAGLSLAVIDPFVASVAGILAPSGQLGDSSGDITLLLVDVHAPLLDGPATYLGFYTLVGGASPDAQDILGSAGLTITTVTPEPSTVFLMLAALAAVSIRVFLSARKRTLIRVR
jgi:hypothetical protein